jgi:hypothetical protein
MHKISRAYDKLCVKGYTMAKKFYVSISPQNHWEIIKPQGPVVQSCFSANPGLKFNPLYRFGNMSFCLFISGSNTRSYYRKESAASPQGIKGKGACAI